MVANTFFDAINKFQWNTYVGVDDFADKLNFLFTVIILLVCISVVTVRQYVLKPISCYLSTDVGGVNLLEYVENFCWVHGTIPLSYNGSVPSTNEEWQEMEKFKILYYQWVPFILGIQCILFHLPRLLWNMICYNQTGTDIQHLITSANQAVHSNEEARSKMTLYIGKTFEQMLFQHRDNRSGKVADFRRQLYYKCSLCVIGKRMGTWIVMGYFSVKILYIGNAIGQLFLMKTFLGFNEISYFGIEILNNVVNGKDWQITLIFPRVAFCYARIRHLGARNNAVVAQCVLPVNMLNEKIFIFLWHWILICGLVSFFSLLMWIARIGIMSNNHFFIRKLLLLNEKILRYDSNHRLLVDKFIRQFLRHDGVFLLRMMSINTGDVITGDVLCHLWQMYTTKYRDRDMTKDLFKTEKDLNGPLSAVPNGHIRNPQPSAPDAAPSTSDRDSYV